MRKRKYYLLVKKAGHVRNEWREKGEKIYIPSTSLSKYERHPLVDIKYEYEVIKDINKGEEDGNED